MSKSLHTNALHDLCSKDQLDLLDSIDSLRSQGISHYVSLPQIIVCGDQSSGKSSVLEAISGVSFPIKSNLCTRFPTELILRKCLQTSLRVSIVPHHSRSESEQLSLSDFHETLDGFDGLPILIDKAKEAMGISMHSKAFSKDLLRVEVSGPDRPHLTIVDLPGLIHSETKKQSVSDVELVQEVVRSYMKEPRSIILAVVSAKNDYANQIVLKLARTADPKGNRTLGVITKPDTLVAGSESETMYVSLARNQDVEFRLGWHVLKNMDTELGECSLEDRDVKEKEFFSQGIWEVLPRSILGIDNLRNRLSEVLLGQIAAELPSLITEIEFKYSVCDNRLKKLGTPRATSDEQRLYLLHISQSFQSLLKGSIDGIYSDPFFEDAKSESGYQKRIRAVVQNLNLEFAKNMATQGHLHEITDSTDTDKSPAGVVPITREKFMEDIEELMRRTRGRELPGTFNPMIVADLFLMQSRPWEAISQSHIKKVWVAVRKFLSFIADHIADAATSKALFQSVFEPALEQLLDTSRAKTTELLTPHQKGHPITYNHYFTEALQDFRNKRNKNGYTTVLKNFFNVSTLDTPVNLYEKKDLRPLVTQLMQRNQPDMNRFASSEALDCMEAYYKVALKRFIDDIAIEVIEAKLISSLENIFSPVDVSHMDPGLVTRIASESAESRAEREQLSKQLEILNKGSDTCKRFIGVRILDRNDSTIQLTPESDSVDEKSSDGGKESLRGDASSLSKNSSGFDIPPSPLPTSTVANNTKSPPSEAIALIPEPVGVFDWDFPKVPKKSKKSKIWFED